MANAHANAAVLEKIENLIAIYLSLNWKGNDKTYQNPVKFVSLPNLEKSQRIGVRPKDFFEKLF